MNTSEVQPAGPEVEVARFNSHRTVRSTLWNALGSTLTQGVAIVASIVVARHVPPVEYGTMGAIAIVLTLGSVLVSGGLVPAIVSGRLSGEREISAAAVLMSAMGLALFLVATLTAPLLAAFFDNPDLRLVLPVGCTVFLFDGLGTVPSCRLQSRHRFDIVARITVTSQVVASVVAVVLALVRRDVWALVIPGVLATAFNTVGYWVAVKRLGLGWPAGPLGLLRPYRQEAVQLTGATLLNYPFRNADNVIVGRVFGQEALGYYSFAYSILMRPIGLITTSVSGALLPALGGVASSRERLSEVVVRACIGIARVAFPVCVGGALVAPELLSLVFGSRWLSATALIQIFLVSGAIQCVVSIIGPVWFALGEIRTMLVWTLLASNVGSIAVFALGALLGSPETVALAFALYSSVVLGPAAVIVTRRVCGLALHGLEAGLFPVIRDTLLMAGSVLLVGRALSHLGANGAGIAAAEILVGVVVYGGLLFRFSPRDTVYLEHLLPRFLSRLRPVAS